jgi:hypothetical protein
MTPEEQATTKGAKFEPVPGGWIAKLMKRGRVLPIATFFAPTRKEAAEMWLSYTKKKS